MVRLLHSTSSTWRFGFNRLQRHGRHGLKFSPDIAQAAMENVLSGIEDADIYIDDVGAFSNDWDHHVNLIATLLQRLRENGFTINSLKYEWAIQETDWLGYWLTP